MPGKVPDDAVVLLVDDEAMVREVAQRLLESLGATVVPADGAESCRSILASPPGAPCLALVDVTLGDGSAEELLGEINRRFPGCHLVAMSGYDARRLPRVPGRDVGFLQKPFGLEALKSVLRLAGLIEEGRSEAGGA